MSSSSDGSDPSLAGKLATVAELRAVADEVSRHIETVVTREDVLRPAREALAAAEKKKQLGNDGFRKGDFLAAYAEYMDCLLYTSPSPRDATLSRMPSSA